MNTKGIIWEPICMLNAGEGTFCNAGVWVMLQLNPTLSLGGLADAIVLLLHVYPFLFNISASLHSLLIQKPHFIPYLSASHPSTYTQRVLFTSGRRNAPSLFPLWWWNERKRTKGGWRKRKKEKRGGITVTNNSALKQQRCSNRQFLLCHYTLPLLSLSASITWSPLTHVQTYIQQAYMYGSSAHSDQWHLGYSHRCWSGLHFQRSDTEDARREWELGKFCMLTTTNSMHSHHKRDKEKLACKYKSHIILKALTINLLRAASSFEAQVF